MPVLNHLVFVIVSYRVQLSLVQLPLGLMKPRLKLTNSLRKQQQIAKKVRNGISVHLQYIISFVFYEMEQY